MPARAVTLLQGLFFINKKKHGSPSSFSGHWYNKEHHKSLASCCRQKEFLPA
jgi:hypothetical protein